MKISRNASTPPIQGVVQPLLAILLSVIVVTIVLAETNDGPPSQSPEHLQQDAESTAVPRIIDGYPVPVAEDALPEPPDTLTARVGVEAILLNWEPSSSAGVTHYAVYRRTTTEETFRVITDTIGCTTFRDVTISASVSYVYYVTAIDIRGQESTPSSPATSIYEPTSPDPDPDPEPAPVVAGRARLIIPEVRATAGETVAVPVNIENADGLCLGAFGLAIRYDASVATAISVTNTALTVQYAFEKSDRGSPGEVYVASIGNCDGRELVGPGSIIWVYFQIHPDVTVNSSLDFIEGANATYIYNRSDLMNSIPIVPVHGQLILGETFIMGDVNGDGVVNAADSAMILQIAAGILEPTEIQRQSGDINGDGVLNSADSAMILYYAANQGWPPTGGVAALVALTSEEGPSGVQLAPGSFDVRLPGNELEVPVQVRVGSVAGATGATFVLQHGEGLRLREEVPIRLNEALAAAYELEVNRDHPDGTRISLAGTVPMPEGLRNLLWLPFEITPAGKANQDTAWVVVTGVEMNDLSGRDFAMSVLSREVFGGAAGIPADCNSDRLIDAGDIPAVVLRVFEGEFGDKPGCDSNDDGTVDAGDISCAVLTAFEGPGQCQGR